MLHRPHEATRPARLGDGVLLSKFHASSCRQRKRHALSYATRSHYDNTPVLSFSVAVNGFQILKTRISKPFVTAPREAKWKPGYASYNDYIDGDLQALSARSIVPDVCKPASVRSFRNLTEKQSQPNCPVKGEVHCVHRGHRWSHTPRPAPPVSPTPISRNAVRSLGGVDDDGASSFGSEDSDIDDPIDVQELQIFPMAKTPSEKSVELPSQSWTPGAAPMAGCTTPGSAHSTLNLGTRHSSSRGEAFALSDAEASPTPTDVPSYTREAEPV